MDTYALRSPAPFTHLRRAASRALTLIEMMIGVAIIGLIAGLVIIQYSHAIDNSEMVSMMMEDKEIAHAVDQYRLDKHSYPASTGFVGVTPALFGGSPNNYMNSAPAFINGSAFLYNQGWSGTYLIRAPQGFDGSMLQSYTAWNTGAKPVPGTSYFVYYSPSYGIFIST